MVGHLNSPDFFFDLAKITDFWLSSLKRWSREFTESWNRDIFRKFYVSYYNLSILAKYLGPTYYYILLSPKFALKLAQLKMSLSLLNTQLNVPGSCLFLETFSSLLNVKAMQCSRKDSTPTLVLAVKKVKKFAFTWLERIKYKGKMMSLKSSIKNYSNYIYINKTGYLRVTHQALANRWSLFSGMVSVVARICFCDVRTYGHPAWK